MHRKERELALILRAMDRTGALPRRRGPLGLACGTAKDAALARVAEREVKRAGRRK